MTQPATKRLVSEARLNDAVAAAVAAPADPAIASAVTTSGSQTQAALDARYPKNADQPINVKDYGAKGDGVTDDGPSITAAIAAAQSAGRAVYLPASVYRVRSMIDAKGSNVRLIGAGMGLTVLKVYGETSVMNRVIGHTGDIDGLTIADMSFVGTVVDDVTAPRRSRTYTSNGFNSALQVAGDLAPNVTTVVRNVRIQRVEVKGAAGLPMLLSGVRGESRVEDSRSELTMDWGWTWCERAICIGNTSYKSADNGFSLSRGCKSVVANGNVAEMCCYWGVWVAGFVVTGAATDSGPTNFEVTGNVVINAGFGGVCADDAPKNGAITGNLVNGVRRGPTDQPTDIRGVGIVIGGFPSNNRTTPTDYAQNIEVSGNTLVDCARGGIEFTGAKNLAIGPNLIVRPGSQFLADGTTIIAATDLANNFGVSVSTGTQSTVSDVYVQLNTIVDDRATAYTNYAWYTSGVTNARVNNNLERGTRQSTVLVHDNTGPNVHSGSHTFSSNIKFTGGATTGANGATGTIAGFDINGAAGSVRAHQFLTAGAKRWLLRASSDAEAGANAGTNFQIDAYDDAGNFVKSMLALSRDGKLAFNGRPLSTPAALPAAATDAATTQALVNAIRAALINMGLTT